MRLVALSAAALIVSAVVSLPATADDALGEKPRP